MPDLSYDIYISSGGSGSPFEEEGTIWEKKNEDILEKLEDPEKVELTQKTVLPLFLEQAIKNLRGF